MSLQHAQALAGLSVPQSNCTVITATGEHAARGAKADGTYEVLVGLEQAKACAGEAVPQANRPISSGAGKHATAWTHANRKY
mgnify:CR=1 FL=1